MNIRRQIGKFQFEAGPLSKNIQGISKIYHEVLLLMKFLLTKPRVKSKNVKYYELYYTVIKNRKENEVVNNKYEDNESNYIIFSDIIIPNHYLGPKNYK